MSPRRYSLAEAYPSWAIWASTKAFISSGTEIFIVVISRSPSIHSLPRMAKSAKQFRRSRGESIDVKAGRYGTPQLYEVISGDGDRSQSPWEVPCMTRGEISIPQALPFSREISENYRLTWQSMSYI